MGAKMVPVEVSPADLKWLAQTIHQAHHNQPQDGPYWDVCSRAVCEWITKKLDEHDAHLNALYTPKFAEDFPITSVSRPSRGGANG